MAYANKQAAFNYINEYQREKYDRITVMAGKGKKSRISGSSKTKRLEPVGLYNAMRR